MTSTTSQIDPASFRVPSILYTGMGRVRVLVVILFRSTKPLSTKRPVAPQSRRAMKEISCWVSVVTTLTLRCREFSDGVEATTYLHGSFRSHHFKRGR